MNGFKIGNQYCNYNSSYGTYLDSVLTKISNGVAYIPLHIENVIFNNPATIVFWSDGSKTVVKCKDEAFDEEKGLAMAISKKVLGNKGNYFNEFKKWLPEIEEDYGPVPFDNMVECACEFGKVIGTTKGDK